MKTIYKKPKKQIKLKRTNSIEPIYPYYNEYGNYFKTNVILTLDNACYKTEIVRTYNHINNEREDAFNKFKKDIELSQKELKVDTFIVNLNNERIFIPIDCKTYKELKFGRSKDFFDLTENNSFKMPNFISEEKWLDYANNKGLILINEK